MALELVVDNDWVMMPKFNHLTIDDVIEKDHADELASYLTDKEKMLQENSGFQFLPKTYYDLKYKWNNQTPLEQGSIARMTNELDVLTDAQYAIMTSEKFQDILKQYPYIVSDKTHFMTAPREEFYINEVEITNPRSTTFEVFDFVNVIYFINENDGGIMMFDERVDMKDVDFDNAKEFHKKDIIQAKPNSLLVFSGMDYWTNVLPKTGNLSYIHFMLLKEHIEYCRKEGL